MLPGLRYSLVRFSPLSSRAFVTAVLAALIGTACRVSLSPLQNHLAPGEEPFAVFVANGEGGTGDLFAVRAEGGVSYPITYTRVRELAPALAPTGTSLAFLREAVAGDPATRRVVVMNLLNGSERILPAVEAPIDALAWDPGGVQLFLRAGSTTYAVPAPPAEGAPRRLDPTQVPIADSAFSVLLGTPAFARAVECPEVGVCIELPSGERSVLDQEGRGAARWGSDSVGYFVGNHFVVRPLGAGHARELRFTPPRAEPRELTFFPGPPPAPAPQ